MTYPEDNMVTRGGAVEARETHDLEVPGSTPGPATTTLTTCPEGHGRMRSEGCRHDARSTYDAPSGAALHLTCPVCGWEAWLDRTGTPFWERNERGRSRLRMSGRGRDPVMGTVEEDVHPGSRAEVRRRIALVRQLGGGADRRENGGHGLRALMREAGAGEWTPKRYRVAER